MLRNYIVSVAHFYLFMFPVGFFALFLYLGKGKLVIHRPYSGKIGPDQVIGAPIPGADKWAVTHSGHPWTDSTRKAPRINRVFLVQADCPHRQPATNISSPCDPQISRKSAVLGPAQAWQRQSDGYHGRPKCLWMSRAGI